MNSIWIALTSLGCSFAGAWLGGFLRERLPEAHRSQETAEVVKLGTGLVGTMAALVLGLLVASAATEFNTEASGVQTMATDFILLDRALGRYGPEAKPARQKLHDLLDGFVTSISSRGDVPPDRAISARTSSQASMMFDAIRDLSPKTEPERIIQNECLKSCTELGKTRWALIQGADNPIPTPFLVVLMFWLTALFLGFGLIAAPNGTVLATLFVCSVSVAAVLFIILDLNQPFDGLIRVSMDPIRYALAEVGK